MIVATIIFACGFIALLYFYWQGGRAIERDRRRDVFRTLVATRLAYTTDEHLNALTLIGVYFYSCDRVNSTHSIYKNHLEKIKNQKDINSINEKDNLLTNLLFEIACVLGLNIAAIDVCNVLTSNKITEQQQMGVTKPQIN